MKSVEEIKKEVQDLVKKFETSYKPKVKSILEEDTKKDLILPLFRILGWSVEKSDEVTAEARVLSKRGDYAFKINGIPQFYLETKKLKESLDDVESIKQSINYAWLKACNWAILTNFVSLKIFNCEWDEIDPSKSLFISLEYSSYVDNIDRLLLISRESFENNRLDLEAEKWGKKSKRKRIDDQLLGDFTLFRELLSKSIIQLNEDRKLTEDELDESVQRVINRLIFIRSCEDRRLEPNHLLSKLREWRTKSNKSLWEVFSVIFRQFDTDYNSKIFENHLCDGLKIGNDVLADIINSLYKNPAQIGGYDFSLIDADILGNIYEQYLGHILRKTPKSAKLSENHVHKKKQGIYYTPIFIVDYIVQNTVGAVLKERKGKLSTISVLDPACGSGSFLLKSYDIIHQYWKDAMAGKLDEYSQNKSIVENNLFGVDLDSHAVEITQLNLLLKISEKGRKLPILRKNIVCGNSLIQDEKIVGDKKMNWNEVFKDIMDKGGFDVVIGNPPYGIVFDHDEKEYLEKKYPTFKRNNDIFVAFIELALNLLSEGGYFGFIIPNTYLIGDYFKEIKKLILGQTQVVKIIDFGINEIFYEPNVYNSILILRKSTSKEKNDENIVRMYNVPHIDDLTKINIEKSGIYAKNEIPQSSLVDLQWKLKDPIVQKMVKLSKSTLGSVCLVKDVGLNYWTIGKGKTRGESIGSRILYDGERKSKDDIAYLKGRDIFRYGYVFGNHWLKSDYISILDPEVDVFRFSEDLLTISPKIIYRQTADRIIATIDTEKYITDKTVHIVVPKKGQEINMYFLLGLLNSRLLVHYYRKVVGETGRVFAQVKTVYLKGIPIKRDAVIEGEIEKIVIAQLKLRKEILALEEKKSDRYRKLWVEYNNNDKKIDILIFRLYDLGKDEIKIIIDENINLESSPRSKS
nr:N-6 DNA methylase [Candidatus Sigynarchaeum springense]